MLSGEKDSPEVHTFQAIDQVVVRACGVKACSQEQTIEKESPKSALAVARLHCDYDCFDRSPDTIHVWGVSTSTELLYLLPISQPTHHILVM